MTFARRHVSACKLSGRLSPGERGGRGLATSILSPEERHSHVFSSVPRKMGGGVREVNSRRHGFEEDKGEVKEKMVSEMLREGSRVKALQEKTSTGKAERHRDEAPQLRKEGRLASEETAVSLTPMDPSIRWKR